MPLLTYSGRPQSKKWVRTAAPKASAVPEPEASSSRTVPPSWTSDTTPRLAPESSKPVTKQPKLSGPKNMHPVPVQKTTWKRKREGQETKAGAASAESTAFLKPRLSVTAAVKPTHVSLGSNTWKRSTVAGDKSADSSRRTGGNSHLTMDASVSLHQPSSSVAASRPFVQPQSMIRHGTHSLALKRKTLSSASKSGPATAALALPPPSRTWKRPRKDNDGEVTAKEASQQKEQFGVGGGLDQAKLLTKIAPNKLVHGRGPVQPPAKNPPRHSHGPVVKRIKLSVHPDRDLNVSRSHSSDGETRSSDDIAVQDPPRDGDGEQHIASAATAGSNAPKSEKQLTDFAYRSLSTKTTTTHNMGRRRAHALHHNALVRVDPSKKPICPTYLKGQDCVNERCTLRHDVPLEYCRPVCSFFQHQGMCLRENCPFRHVKLERDAIPCPSFEMYGYCQDEKCPMMHASRKKKVKGSLTDTGKNSV